MTKKWNECLRLILLTSLAAQVLMAGIIGVQSVDTYSPTSYSLLGMTSRVSGALADVQIDDGNSMVFRSYDGGTATVEYADNNVSDVDLSHSKGFQSNFSAQQNGPDSVCDVLTEENTGGGFPPNYELDLEVQWRNVNFGEQDEELAICLDRGVNSRSLDATGGYVIIGDGTPDWGSVEGTISFWVKMDNFIQGRCWGQDGNMETRWSGTNLVLDWGYASSLISATSFTANIWYFVAIVWDENNDTLFLYVGTETNAPTIDANSLDGTWTATTPSPTENRFLNGLGADQPLDGHGDELRYWDIAWSPAEIQSDYNSELNGSEPNLRSYFQFDNNLDDFGPDGNDASTIGACLFSSDVPFSPSPSENLQVDVWGGDSWHSLFANLVEGWNNVSIAPFLNSSTLTIRFKGGSDSGDTRQDSWKIDVALIRTRSKEQTIEVELTGVSNQEGWSQLTWTVVCSWTTSSVNVVLQLYNYTLGGYATHGSGFAHYLSSTSQG
ncbi:MAG: LamG domain-containing protein, partial [Candidatus Bathyarchaeota archaeon]|nr:LamG domain-containing protein [Candidatus Bathyarchaeota archaeon]